jgi:hypothetical protein
MTQAASTPPDQTPSQRSRLEAAGREETFVAHDYPEHLVDLGEVRLNYATVGDSSLPPLLLIPGQTESWWGYESAMPLLAERTCASMTRSGRAPSGLALSRPTATTPA